MTVDVHRSGSEPGFVTVSVAAGKFTRGTGLREWNVASNELKVFVGAPFSIKGESSAHWSDRSYTTAVGTYGVSDSEATTTWSLTGDDSDKLQITRTSGKLSFVGIPESGNPTDQDNDGVYRVTVNATSDDYALFEDVGVSFTATKEVEVTVTLGSAHTSFFSSNRWASGYGRGDWIQVVVWYPTDVLTVTGTPQITLDIGGFERLADYHRVADGGSLVFRYRVVGDDQDLDGASVVANSLSLNGGSILDERGNPVSLAHGAVAGGQRHEVVASPLQIDSVTFTSRPKTSADGYGKGEHIEISVATFPQEPLTVTGTPQLVLEVGPKYRVADFVSNNGGVLLFRYTVVTGDTDTDGISIDEDSLRLNGGTINDQYGEAVPLAHLAVDPDSNHTISAPPATVTRVSIEDPYRGDRYNLPVPAPGDIDYPAYGQGDVVVVFVEFSEAVSVGTRTDPETEAEIGPTLTLSIGDTTADAAYVSISGRKLRFEYTVAVGDTDTDGISIDADSLSLNGTTVNDATGVAAALSHTEVVADPWLAVVAPGGL